jgi:hypothetical protein
LLLRIDRKKAVTKRLFNYFDKLLESEVKGYQIRARQEKTPSRERSVHKRTRLNGLAF